MTNMKATEESSTDAPAVFTLGCAQASVFVHRFEGVLRVRGKCRWSWVASLDVDRRGRCGC